MDNTKINKQINNFNFYSNKNIYYVKCEINDVRSLKRCLKNKIQLNSQTPCRGKHFSFFKKPIIMRPNYLVGTHHRVSQEIFYYY